METVTVPVTGVQVGESRLVVETTWPPNGLLGQVRVSWF